MACDEPAPQRGDDAVTDSPALIPPAAREPASVLLSGIVLFIALLLLAWNAIGSKPTESLPSLQDMLNARLRTYLVEMLSYHQ